MRAETDNDPDQLPIPATTHLVYKHSCAEPMHECCVSSSITAGRTHAVVIAIALA